SRPGEPYDDLTELYGGMMGQWATELNHVTGLVGGFNSQQKHGGQDGVRFVIVPKERQAAAVRFLHENAFATPSWALKPEILRRIEPAGVLTRVNSAQERVLNSLLSNARFDRLVEQEAIDGATAYRPADFMADVRRGIWSELEGGPVRIDVYRRKLQNSYIEALAAKLNVRPTVTDDYRALIKAELRDLSAAIAAASARAVDRQTRAHLADARDEIAKALDPKFAAPAAPALQIFPFGYDEQSELFGVLDCWVDHSIRPNPRDP
ncbi:MAG TPA: zinc-dependent metalloprotease, partial [Pyrinomonadaceae bacterium]|nr:zinc-dependent metalloprotease [Pyrinomonadaceae bacterium]